MVEEGTLEIPIQGMDCAECTIHVQKAIADLPGVKSAHVFLVTEKALVRYDPNLVNLSSIRGAVEGAGYSVPESGVEPQEDSGLENFTRPVLVLLALVFGVVLFVIVVGEWLGLFETLTDLIPWSVGVAVVLIGGYPVFRKVVRAALNGQVIAHTLMTVGVVAALLAGEWATAFVVVFFMRVGDYVEHFTAGRARRAVKDLTEMSPQIARLERDGDEVEVPVEQVEVGDTVSLRPGEKIPVDGEVLSGNATIDQATITGESMPVEAGPGSTVYAATLVSLGALRVRATHVGEDTTFGCVIKMVEESEANRADVQRVADKFSAYYLPVVAIIAALTFIIRRDPMATVAVLVVACSCAFALATPIAMLASIGAGAKRGLMIKGGKYLELLAQADVILIDKTGTLTLGKPEIVECRSLNDDIKFGDSGHSEVLYQHLEILRLAASAEKYSEHPLAEAVRDAAYAQRLVLEEPQDFVSIPGLGVQATVGERRVGVGSARMFNDVGQIANLSYQGDPINQNGKTLLFVAVDGELVGVLEAADRMRPEVPAAIQEIFDLGIREVELLTGDNQGTASAIAGRITEQLSEGCTIRFRANLMPEDKIRIVKGYQEDGYTVIMVGDGVNDAPALAQADVGIAMGAAGSAVAIEAAHVALMNDDWLLVPEVIRIAHRTMRVVKMNIGFTAIYNLAGLTLAALGYLPPVLAAAAQSLPDLGILANSSRLLRQGWGEPVENFRDSS